ncbi:MAG: DUF418 domain-containing protein [Proteobacteria bacterium]|nr:DUF418 domain-containing protein [Pseudomonadota bacterium]
MSEEIPPVESSQDVAPATEIGPVVGMERIDAIDKLPGIAVAGILVMNIYAFAMPFTAYSNPLAHGGTEWYNLATWYFTHIFFDQKFLPIFSMLFGAGLVMMAGKAEARGTKFGGIWYRRSFWLLMIGTAHSYLIWFGDILFHYALFGMLIYPLRNKKPLTLIIIACIVLPIALPLGVGGGAHMQKLQAASAEIVELQAAGEELGEEQITALEEWEEMSVFLDPPEVAVQKDLEAYKKGYGEIVVHRAPVVGMMHTSAMFFLVWWVGGLMILRIALTNYLLHSVILTTVFYGYGLGLYGTIPRIWQMTLVIAVVGFQLWFSPIWLKHYRFGPVEWLCRSLTYWHRQPLRRAASQQVF